MTIGLTIPGVDVVHPRETWEAWLAPGVPTVEEMNPPRVVWSDVTQPVAHYPAADDLIDGDPGESADQLPRWVANMHTAYTRRQPVPYAIGYWFTIDWLGGVWELRGFDYRSAANAHHNWYTAPIQFMVDGKGAAAEAPTAEAIASARAVWRECRRRALAGGAPKFADRPYGHDQLRQHPNNSGKGTITSCPSPTIQNLIDAGTLDLGPEEDAPMLEFVKTHADDAAVLLLDRAAGTIRSAVSVEAIRAVEALGIASNTWATARVLTNTEWSNRKGLVWLGGDPDYDQDNRRGPRTVRVNEFAQSID